MADNLQRLSLPYYADGLVVSGFGRGSKSLGCPTANFPESVVDQLPDTFECGVYYGWASVDGGIVYPMVMSIGYNPQFDNNKKTMETHILHTFESDFYNCWLRIVILGFLRPMVAFAGLVEGSANLTRDHNNMYFALLTAFLAINLSSCGCLDSMTCLKKNACPFELFTECDYLYETIGPPYIRYSRMSSFSFETWPPFYLDMKDGRFNKTNTTECCSIYELFCRHYADVATCHALVMETNNCTVDWTPSNGHVESYRLLKSMGMQMCVKYADAALRSLANNEAICPNYD